MAVAEILFRCNRNGASIALRRLSSCVQIQSQNRNFSQYQGRQRHQHTGGHIRPLHSLNASIHQVLLEPNISTLLNLNAIRFKSTDPSPIVESTTNSASNLASQTPFIPEPPTPGLSEAVEQLNSLGEPTLSSLGLCSWWPSGWVQSLLESVHVTADIPWWGTLACFAVGLRLVMIPLQVYAMKISIHQGNVLPKYMELHTDLKKASMQGDFLSASLIDMKLQEYVKTHKPNPRKQIVGIAYQSVIFLSVMSGIRGMTNLPVQSMTTGGAYWFTDLTVGDPFFILPVLTATTLLLNIELGAEGLRMSTISTRNKWLLRGFIGVILPTMMSFAPSALAVYWFTSNIMAVGISAVIKAPGIKQKLGIPNTIKPKPPKTTVNEGIMQKVKRMSREKTIESAQASKESINAKAFADAGRALPVKTFKYNPTKVSAKQ